MPMIIRHDVLEKPKRTHCNFKPQMEGMFWGVYCPNPRKLQNCLGIFLATKLGRLMTVFLIFFFFPQFCLQLSSTKKGVKASGLKCMEKEVTMLDSFKNCCHKWKQTKKVKKLCMMMIEHKEKIFWTL